MMLAGCGYFRKMLLLVDSLAAELPIRELWLRTKCLNGVKYTYPLAGPAADNGHQKFVGCSHVIHHCNPAQLQQVVQQSIVMLSRFETYQGKPVAVVDMEYSDG
jgi:hypothetical protein